MYDDDYDEGEIERFGREGGRFLLDGIIDTNELKEISKFKENVRKSNKFNILKLNERSESTMFDYELKDLIEEFNDEEIDEDIEKALKEMPEKLKEALGEAYKILVEYKADMAPELLAAVKLMARLATGKPEKYPLPSKYPYPKKVKKAMGWQGVQDMLFGGHLPSDDDEEIEKSSKEDPFPSITRAIEIKKQVIDDVEEEMEEDSNYDDEDE